MRAEPTWEDHPRLLEAFREMERQSVALLSQAEDLADELIQLSPPEEDLHIELYPHAVALRMLRESLESVIRDYKL